MVVCYVRERAREREGEREGEEKDPKMAFFSKFMQYVMLWDGLNY